MSKKKDEWEIFVDDLDEIWKKHYGKTLTEAAADRYYNECVLPRLREAVRERQN